MDLGVRGRGYLSVGGSAGIEAWGMKVALGRAGTPRECGDVIAFLLSERASYLTGALVNVDGRTDF